MASIKGNNAPLNNGNIAPSDAQSQPKYQWVKESTLAKISEKTPAGEKDIEIRLEEYFPVASKDNVEIPAGEKGDMSIEIIPEGCCRIAAEEKVEIVSVEPPCEGKLCVKRNDPLYRCVIEPRVGDQIDQPNLSQLSGECQRFACMHITEM